VKLSGFLFSGTKVQRKETMKVEQDVRKIIIVCDSEIEAGNLTPVLKVMLERNAMPKEEQTISD
jgi:hypothetical protein